MKSVTNKTKVGGAIIGVLLLVLSFGAGYFVASDKRAEIEKVTTLSNKETGKQTPVDFSPFWKAWNTLNEKFVATHASGADVTDQDKVWGAIEGLTSSLNDPYTVFFPPADKKIFDSEISGNFEGIGMEVGIKDGIITVISALKGTPAERSGIKAGDKLLKIDNTSTQDLSIDKAVSLIRGKKGTQVKITVIREGVKEPIEFTLTREVINIPTIDTELRKDGIFVISLYSFSENSPQLFRDALVKFADSGSNKLILDLRGNPGGYLEAAVSMASWFLPKGDVVVREDYGKGKPEDVLRSAGFDVFDKNLRLIILVDGGSASASEILAGALREHGVAKLVGEKTFGKGSVQEVVDLTLDTSLKITIARWLTPNGVSISEEGLKPDVEVKNVEPKEGQKPVDAQMNKAVEILNKV